MQSLPTMPDDFPEQVHQALKSWHNPMSVSSLDALLLARASQDNPLTLNWRYTSRDVLEFALEKLMLAQSDVAKLLVLRFQDKATAQEIAYARNVSVDVVYQRQRAAIAQLAQILWEEEHQLREAHARQILSRLSAPTYTKLFGVGDKVTELRAQLETPNEPWIVAFEGLGGMGKTSLADALVRELAYGTHFENIAWISARQRLFQMGNIAFVKETVNLTPAELVDRLVLQLDLAGLKRESEQAKFLGVQAYLAKHPCLIVVDNLETAHDCQSLLPRWRELVGPSKFLITTRYSLRGEGGIYSVSLQGLSEQDTLAFIRYEAQLQALPELAQTSDVDLLPIYELTGGNPLAIRLIIGQLHTFPLPTILERLISLPDDPTSDLLTFIYDDVWQTLSPTCRWVMQALSMVPQAGGRLEHIAAVAGFDVGPTAACIRTLARHALISVIGDLTDKRYALHPLTQTFLSQHPLEAPPNADDDD